MGRFVRGFFFKIYDPGAKDGWCPLVVATIIGRKGNLARTMAGKAGERGIMRPKLNSQP